ncbi:MAG: hypothetical protein IT210_23130 [Armatimonadetes bacterium]|nr:hypothetical protein [Armatimonadota bacterium]
MNERIEVLKLIESGVLSPEEGQRLLGAMGTGPEGAASRLQVLEMLTSGKVSAEEAVRLMGAMDKGVGAEAPVPAGRKAKLLKIRVNDADGSRVNVNIPVALASIALRFMPSDALESLHDRNLDADSLLQMLKDDVPEGDIVDIEEADGTQVKISIE